jgi:hypothetical protein
VRVGADRGDDVGLAVTVLEPHPGLLVERVDRRLQRLGDALEHLLGRLAQPALDLREVGVGDARHARELAHGEGLELALAPDDVAEGTAHMSIPPLTAHTCPVM